MKNWIFAAIAILGLGFMACEKEQVASDEALIQEIALASQQNLISPSDLPASAQDLLDEQFFETYPEDVYSVSSRGYMVELGNGETLFMDALGRLLEFEGEHDRTGPFGDRHPHGHCYRLWRRFGRLVPIDSLPEAIPTYVADNYTDASIRRAKKRGDFFFVLITGPTVLKFDLDGNFIEEVSPLAHCNRPCRDVDEDVQPIIQDYISTNFPNATVRRVCARVARIYVWLSTDDGRKVVVFDTDGNYLFERS